MGTVRSKQRGALGLLKPLELRKELMKGQQPWTDEEDGVLKENYPRPGPIHLGPRPCCRYAEHPLFAELLTAELPEASRRSVVQVGFLDVVLFVYIIQLYI